jgi:hypothetical protein
VDESTVFDGIGHGVPNEKSTAFRIGDVLKKNAVPQTLKTTFKGNGAATIGAVVFKAAVSNYRAAFVTTNGAAIIGSCIVFENAIVDDHRDTAPATHCSPRVVVTAGDRDAL